MLVKTKQNKKKIIASCSQHIYYWILVSYSGERTITTMVGYQEKKNNGDIRVLAQ